MSIVLDRSPGAEEKRIARIRTVIVERKLFLVHDDYDQEPLHRGDQRVDQDYEKAVLMLNELLKDNGIPSIERCDYVRAALLPVDKKEIIQLGKRYKTE